VQLLAGLGRLKVRVQRAVEIRRSRDPEGDDPFRGLHVSEAQVESLLGGRPPLEVGVSGDEPRAAVLLGLVDAFGLDNLDLDILLVALAPDLDAGFEPLYGYLHDDVSRRRASIGLALELSGLSPSSGAHRSRLGPAGPLVRSGLILVEDPDRPFLIRPLRVPDRVARHLLGDADADPPSISRT
jgi:hypothetical protein